MTRYFAHLTLGMILTASLHGLSAAQGNPNRHEIGDVVFRTLAFPFDIFDDHGGIFWQYTTGNPNDPVNSILIEMLGSPTNRIVTNSMFNFRNVPSSSYRGAFRHPSMALSLRDRDKILMTILNMRDRVSRPIGYVSNPVLDYLEWDDHNRDGQLQLNEITHMRSDAVVEFAYAANGFPIIRHGGATIITNPNLFRNLANRPVGPLRPSDQHAAMIPAVVDNPVAELRDAGGRVILDGGASNTRSISVKVRDEYSGPGRLELWRDAVNTGQLVAVNNVSFRAIEHVYTARDEGLAVFADLPEGQFIVRAIDRAGNWGRESTVSFHIVRTPPRLALINADGERLDHGSISQNANVTLSATRNPAPVRSIELFTGNILTKTMPVPPGKDMTFPMTLVANAWYYGELV